MRVCPSGKSVDPKFLSSNGVLAHSRIAEEYASIRELIASVNTSASRHLSGETSHNETSGQFRRIQIDEDSVTHPLHPACY